MPNKKKEQIVTVPITEFSKKGNGTGITDNAKKAEIPFTCPGDIALAEIKGKKSGKYPGKLLELLKPSSDRTLPRCIHFASCGGCRWQHLPYELQLEIKQSVVKKLFSPFLNPQTYLMPIAPCSTPWAYRNKMEFSFSNDKKGEKFLGLILDSSRGKVFNLTECHLVNPWMAEGLQAVRLWWEGTGLKAYHGPSNSGSLRTLIFREGMSTGDRLAMLTVSGNPEFALKKDELQDFVLALQKAIEPKAPGAKLSIFLRIQQILAGKPTEFFEMHLSGPDTIRETLEIAPVPSEKPMPFHFKISPSSFFQPNTKQAERLYSLALQMAELTGEEIVYDLYCGGGALGISLSRFAKQVISVELSEESALDARTNVKENGIANVTVLTGACQSILHKVREEKSLDEPDIVLLDPPRAGLDAKTMEEVLKLNSQAIIYISCNPESQANDIKLFLENGYLLLKLQPVDQFPQTVHIENIALLKKMG